MAISNSFYTEGVPYAAGMTVGVGAPLDLRCKFDIPAQLAVLGRGNVYEGMPFFIKNFDLHGNFGYFLLLARPYKTELNITDGNIMSVSCWPDSNSEEPIIITEDSTMTDLKTAGYDFERIRFNEQETIKMNWLNLCYNEI